MTETKTKAILSVSGGLDSTTLLYHVVKELNRDVTVVAFDYGQNHNNEVEFARYHAEKLGVPFKLIKLADFFRQINHTSALLNGADEVPEHDYQVGDPTPPTYVSNRNLFFTIIMSSIAEEVGAEEIYLGIQRVDEFSGYWDTTLSFVDKVQQVLDENRSSKVKLVTPFVEMTKSDEILIGNKLGLDYAQTISCYKGTNCGVCSTCRERIAAFEKVGLKDPITYLNEQ